MSSSNGVRVAMIGFGEVGKTFSRGLHAAGGFRVSAYDILLDDDAARPRMEEAAAASDVRLARSAADAANDADVVISAVTAASAVDVAEEAGSYLKPGQFFLDVNSVSPRTKRRDAEAVARSGADYVEAAVMAPVAPYGITVPIVLGGPAASALKQVLEGAGMALTIGDPEIGKASALKLCRSIMVKGFEALAVECFMAARLYDVEEEVFASLGRSYPGLDWEHFAGYKIGRTVEHGRRRAAEMREAADTVAETGLTPSMAAAIAERIDWVADQVQAQPELRTLPDEAWRTTLDRMAGHAALRRMNDPA